jgi:hypothetical protein
MFPANFNNMIFSKRFPSFTAIICASLLGLHCTSKEQSPASDILKSLHIGLSLDSAKILTEESGWTCDTPTTNPQPPTPLNFRNIHLPEIEGSFSMLLIFRNERLATIGIVESSDLLSHPNSLPAHNIQVYKQMVTMFQSMYFGNKSSSASNIDPLIHIGNHIDTTFSTTWTDTTMNRYYFVQYDALYGRLTFTAF